MRVKRSLSMLNFIKVACKRIKFKTSGIGEIKVFSVAVRGLKFMSMAYKEFALKIFTKE